MGVRNSTEYFKFEISHTGDVELMLKLSDGRTVKLDQKATLEGARRIVFSEEKPEEVLIVWHNSQTTRSHLGEDRSAHVKLIAARRRAEGKTREQLLQEIARDLPRDKIVVAALQMMRMELVNQGKLEQDEGWSVNPETINQEVTDWVAKLDARDLVKLRLLAEDLRLERISVGSEGTA